MKLILKNIEKRFGDKVALRDFSLEVKEGEFIVVVGPSGCGKSTLLRIIAGLERQDKGEVWIDGKRVDSLPPRERNIAMVFQDYALYPHMTVYENIAFGLRLRKMKKEEMEERVKNAARILKLEDKLKRYPRELSGGERQRVALGRAIVRNPSLFLFDEPLSNLDAKLRNEMRKELIKLREEVNGTFIYVTHDQIEAMTMGDRIVVIKQGEIQQVGTPRELYEHPQNLFVATFIGTPSMNIVKGRIEKGKFISPSFSFPVETQYEGDAFLGIRPENLVPGEGIKGTLEVAEPTGKDIFLHVRVKDEVLVASVPSGEWRGERDISLSVRKYYIFDREGRLVDVRAHG
ncbi:sugar ABC transporter ATP-binding protein [bacterium]|nr:MAG: sugar ABC transporter ATP-binding protein [bacterium]